MEDNVEKKNAPVQALVKRHRFSPVWLIPIVAAGLAVYLAYGALANRGPEVTLALSTADGLVVDQTQVKHRDVPLGMVNGITLAPDMRSVVVKVRMNGGTKSVLTDRARFWVVRPRLTAGSITGLETIVSGAYIEVDPGEGGGRAQTKFKALDEPPGRESDEPGQVFALKAARLGSLSVGAPIFYRDVSVGEVLGYDLGAGLGPVSLRIFVREPYDRFVHKETRFWNASGISLTTGADGMHVELESLQALLSGGVAFETPRETENGSPAPEGATFELYDSKATADAASFLVNLPFVTYFKTSVQGLTRGSPVQLFGVQVGSVTDVKLVYDAETRAMVARVAFEVQPERILPKDGDKTVPDDVRAAFTETRLRAVLESSSFITGTKDLSLERVEGKTAAELPKEGEAIVLPSQGGGLDGLTASLSDVAAKVDKIPFEQIGHNANDALASVQRLASDIDTNAGPALQRLPAIADEFSELAKNANGALGPAGYGPSSEFQRNMEHLMHQLNDAARSYRVLADYLDRHPEALIRGRGGEAQR